MNTKDSLKILLLSDAPMALNEGGICQTLYNLFSFIEPQNILAIAPVEELKVKPATAPFTGRYLSYRHLWIKILANRITKPLFPLLERVNLSISQLRSYQKIRKGILTFRPDVIISCPNTPIGVLMHKKLLKGIKNIPVVPYFMDDWMYTSKQNWAGENVNDIVSGMLTGNKRWIMISNELAGIFKERYNANPEAVLCARNPVDTNNAPPDKVYVKGEQFTIAYAGALWPMHYDSFCIVAKAVQKLSAETNIRLVWYTPQSYWDWRKNDLIPLGVEYGGHIAYKDVHATLNKADLLLITSSFRDEYYTHSKGSLQTKITDYCKAKRLIISCGPAYSANHNFIKQEDCGICCETEDADVIAGQLLQIMNNMASYDKCIVNGWNSLKKLSKDVVHRELKNFLISTVKAGT